MRFILVNGRTPCRQSVCALCCRPIATSYLREIATRLPYCDPDCYANHCERAALAPRKSCDSDMRSARHIDGPSNLVFPW
jgi:hypothetical protein